MLSQGKSAAGATEGLPLSTPKLAEALDWWLPLTILRNRRDLVLGPWSPLFFKVRDRLARHPAGEASKGDSAWDRSLYFGCTVQTRLMFQHQLSLQGMALSIGLRLWNQRVGAQQRRKRMKRDEEGVFYLLSIITLVLLCYRFWILALLRLHCWRWINVQDLQPGSPWKPAPIAPRQELVKDLTRKVLRIMSNVLPPNHSDVCSSVLSFHHVEVTDD